VPSAQATLGHLLLRGLPGIAPDYAESRRWLSVAASHHPQAAHDLSTLYRNGELGMARDEDAYWAHVKESEHDLKHVSRP
jgi:TPR repeat protein